jgi:hypothetical protein
MHISRFYLGGAALLSAAMLTSAHAQGTPTLPANVPPPGGTDATRPLGVSVVAAPPAGFNPLTASPAARQQFAVPPAPDPTAAPKAYEQWKKAVGGPQNRVAAPVLTQTNISNGPIKTKKVVGQNLDKNAGPISNNVVVATSGNWSGPSIVAKGKPFAVEAIIGEFVVPTAHQAFGSCTGGWDYSSQWPGIDGNGSGDVLQAGVEVDAYCNGGTTASFYSAWIEWFPFNETRVSSPAIHPGDLVLVEVWNVSSTVGYAYFYNYSTQQAAEYQLTAPGGTTLQGNSIEWIVERPGVGGGLATLTNYIDVSWPYNVAWNYAASPQHYYYPGVDPNPRTLELIAMLDNAGNGISYGSPQDFGFVYFEDYGSANGGSVSPYY